MASRIGRKEKWMQGAPGCTLDRLAPEPLGYATARFVLRDDLEHLERVSRTDAPEAVILYCARILEALASDAIRLVGQEPGANVFSNLTLLEYLNRLDTAMRYWAHTLRRLGNQIRHIHSRIRNEEADLSIRLIERWLEWYFCRFSHGPRLHSLTRDERPLGLGCPSEASRILQTVESLESPTPNQSQSGCLDFDECPEFLRTPILPAAAAEVLLGRNREADALQILQTGLARFPEDVRLRQLMGVYWRRAGDLDSALRYLQPLYAESGQDEETAGMVASVHKQRWLNDRADQVSLAEAHRAYRAAWLSSRMKNCWLGINAAATAAYLGKHEAARRLASDIETVLRDRAVRLPPDLRDSPLGFNYWDQVTLAEAQLLSGQRHAAEQTYATAFARFADRTGDIEVSRRQKEELLDFLGSNLASQT